MEYTNLIVKATESTTVPDTALEKLLKDGWKVTQMCPMPCAGSDNAHYKPTCLVILEKF